MIDQDKITSAFKTFRQKAKEHLGGKVYARQAFMCCSGCASSALTTEIKNFNAKGLAKAIGAIWYHKQDAHGMNQGNDLYIGYGAAEAVGDCSRDLMTKRIGEILVACLEAEGLEVEWDGDIRSRVMVVSKAKKIAYA